jgi:hypothetical protein
LFVVFVVSSVVNLFLVVIQQPSLFVHSHRSTTLDNWRPTELKLMEAGGNLKAAGYFRQHGAGQQEGKFTDAVYSSRAAEQYRHKLRVEALGETGVKRLVS